MANKDKNAYALTVLCPILRGVPDQPQGNCESHTALLRDVFQTLHVNEQSPMAQVPNTYLCRFWVLDDVPYQGKPAYLEHLQSAYLVFSADFHGELDAYLEGMWQALGTDIPQILQHCVEGAKVKNVQDFKTYIKKCQVTTTFFFNGSTDESLAEQLKSLYLKQEFSTFAFDNQGKSPADLQKSFREFVERTQPAKLSGPTWAAGGYHLNRV